MEEFNNIVPISINKYFTKLSESGKGDAESIVILTAILYILNTFKLYINDCDIKILNKVIYCISGNCLIDFPSSISEDSLFHSIKNPIESVILELCKCNKYKYDTLFNNIYCM